MDRVTATVTSEPAGVRPHDRANLVEVDDVKVHFPVRGGVFSTTKATVKAVDGVTFDVRRGETLGLVGESGCGKSTIGRAMIRLRDTTSGTVRFDGIDLGSLSANDLRRTRRRMQIIFQDPYGSLDPRMTVGAIIAEPLETHGLATGVAKQERIADLLRLVGLDPQYVTRYPHEFSGGQRQRIGVARALAVEPEFIVCDEPISALDVSIQAQVLNLLTDLKQRLGLTYLFVAHDLSVVKHISDRVAVMYLGKIVEIGPPEQLYAAPGHPYTRALLSAVPVPDPAAERKRKRVILKGDVPSPVNPPPGCRFHTRCWLYERLGQPEACRTIDPPLMSVANAAEHNAACHFADEALKTDVGIAHIGEVLIRRGTPATAIAVLESGKTEGPTEEQIAAFAAPAFADLSKEGTEVETSEGLTTEDPNAGVTKSDQADAWRKK
jgi:oligopeptide transport system ATP-binding protein